MHLTNRKNKAFLRCWVVKCLTITAITIALSAANKPSKNTKKSTSTHKSGKIKLMHQHVQLLLNK